MNKKNILTLAIALFSLGLASCAHYVPPSKHKAQYADQDPIEGLNRMVFSINEAADTFLVRPVAVTYRDWAPTPVKNRVGDFLSHIKLPTTFINNAFQGEWDKFGENFGRFMVNTIIGLGGFIDVYPEKPKHVGFGDSLAHWGVGEGAYVVLPAFGPSNARDTVGTVVDLVTNPLNWTLFHEFEVAATKSYVQAVHNRADTVKILDDIKKTSVDFYAKIRSISRQQRYNENYPEEKLSFNN